MNAFDLRLSRVQASLIGMNTEDARHFWTMVAALRTFNARMLERDGFTESYVAR